MRQSKRAKRKESRGGQGNATVSLLSRRVREQNRKNNNLIAMKIRGNSERKAAFGRKTTLSRKSTKKGETERRAPITPICPPEQMVTNKKTS